MNNPSIREKGEEDRGEGKENQGAAKNYNNGANLGYEAKRWQYGLPPSGNCLRLNKTTIEILSS